MLSITVILQPQLYYTIAMFQFRFSFSFSFSRSRQDQLRELNEKVEKLKLESDKRYQQLQTSEVQRKTDVAQLKKKLSHVKAERDVYEKAYEEASEKCDVMLK